MFFFGVSLIPVCPATRENKFTYFDCWVCLGHVPSSFWGSITSTWVKEETILGTCKPSHLLTCSGPKRYLSTHPGGAVWGGTPGPSYLTLVQPGILHSVVQLAQLLVGVAHVFVPQPCLTLCRDVEELPHLLLDGCWGQGDTSLWAFSRCKDNSRHSKLRLIFRPFGRSWDAQDQKIWLTSAPWWLLRPNILHGASFILKYPKTAPRLLIIRWCGSPFTTQKQHGIVRKLTSGTKTDLVSNTRSAIFSLRFLHLYYHTIR